MYLFLQLKYGGIFLGNSVYFDPMFLFLQQDPSLL